MVIESRLVDVKKSKMWESGRTGDYYDKMIFDLCYYGMSSNVQGDNGLELHISMVLCKIHAKFDTIT